MSARDDRMIMLKVLIQDALNRVRTSVNSAVLHGNGASNSPSANWSQGQISALWLLYADDPDVPQDIADNLRAARVEAQWLMSGQYPEKQPCAWPN